MEAFLRQTGTIAVVPDDNVDTDRIIPARFLTRVSRFGYGELLFCDVRGPEFPLDRPEANGAIFLVVGNNFGCGSSREHAVWAIQQGGFRAVISHKKPGAPGFADIFRQNSANCGLLLIELDDEPHAALVAAGSGATVTVDLPAQTVQLGDQVFAFDANPVTKDAIVKGLDLIGTTLTYAPEIEAYEKNHETFVGRPQ